jgi:hypothetical protein
MTHLVRLAMHPNGTMGTRVAGSHPVVSSVPVW